MAICSVLEIMEELNQIQIISFYEFKDLLLVGSLDAIKRELKDALLNFEVRGTIILSVEGFNGMVCGLPDNTAGFILEAGGILQTTLRIKSSFNETPPFRKIDVKIKPEIVTLKKAVDIAFGTGTHVDAREWNSLVSQPDVLLLDARNDYEFASGTFQGAVNPHITKFSDLPLFVAENLDPIKHKRIAMFCTGGIRCEKFAPYMKQIGFEEVYQLDGGILKYLEDVPADEQLWEGECFVFDERTTVDSNLTKGSGPDYSQRHSNAKKPRYKVAR